MLTNLSPFEPGGPLHAMTVYKQWLLFQRTEWNVTKQKWDKKPIQANGYGMPWRSDPSKLMTYADAVRALSHHADCVLGFVISEGDPFFCLDIDHCAVDGGWSREALDLINLLPQGIVEVSMSGDGLHVWGSTLDMPHACDNDALQAEFYTKHRAMALTGSIAESENDITADSTFDVMNLVDVHFPRAEIAPRRNGEGATTEDLEKARAALPFVDPTLRYAEWLAICMGLHAAGVEADAEELAFEIAHEYCEQANNFVPGELEFKWGTFDASREDRATLGSLFHHAKAGGYKTREELDAAEAFKDFQIAEVAKAVPPPPPTTAALPDIKVEVEEREMGIRYPNDYIKIFGSCVYVRALHAIWTPDGQLLDQKRFDAEYSGYQYALDMEARKCTDNPWEAFFKCRVYKFKRVNATCFKPDLPTGAIITHEGRTFINTYWPIPVPRKAGDVTPFLTHLAKVLPDERDRRILLTYMAALVQNPGIKFQWAPLLQGVEGNGKTFFTYCLENAVGSSYTHYPQAQDLDNKFNAWLVGKLLIAVEDIFVPGHKANIIETLKPMITGTRAGIQGKGTDQITMTVCANFMFNSNHRGAIGNAVKGRRYCVFYTAQQEPEHLVRDGMTGEYFTSLYKWARNGGFAAITDYLFNYQLDAEFNPAGFCQVAPATSTHSEVLEEALGTVEQEVMAAVTEERPGFVAPWISSLALDRLLTQTGYDKRVPRNKRRAMLESLGYVRHPNLVEGRTNNAVLPDASKTSLFVKKGHPALELQGPALIADRYSKAQQATPSQVAAAFTETKES